MKNLGKELFYKFRWARICITFVVRLYHQMHILLIPDIRHLRRIYFDQNRRYPNLEKPELFSEKIIWLKLNVHSDLHQQCADKIRVRDYVSGILGQEVLIPCYGIADRISRELIDQIPDGAAFIVKTNHGSSGGVSFQNKSDVNLVELDSIMSHHMVRNHYYQTREKQYKSITPRILIEKLLVDSEQPPMDYKFFCFNGTARFVQVDIDRHTNHTRNLYDRDWTKIPVTFCYENGRDIEKPQRLDEMLAMAEKLANIFYFVRVDFYAVGDKIYFGEITFHPESGMMLFDPIHYEKLFGSYLTLPIKAK
jgi:hypothetical protein